MWPNCKPTLCQRFSGYRHMDNASNHRRQSPSKIHLGIFWGWDRTKDSLYMSFQRVIGWLGWPYRGNNMFYLTHDRLRFSLSSSEVTGPTFISWSTWHDGTKFIQFSYKPCRSWAIIGRTYPSCGVLKTLWCCLCAVYPNSAPTKTTPATEIGTMRIHKFHNVGQNRRLLADTRRWPDTGLTSFLMDSYFYILVCFVTMFCLPGKSEMAGSNSAQAFSFQRNRKFLPSSLVKIQYVWEPLWPRGSVLDLRPPGDRISNHVS